jgi:CheY-like chemotaxis protein
VKKEFICFLIDDDIDDQEIFLRVLKDFEPSIRCFTACNGQEAIDKLTSKEVKPDLIFLDLNMPLMNGKQFLKECHFLEGCRDIPVIILTTAADKRTIEETKQLGASDYITKPDKFSSWGSIIKEKVNAYRKSQE